MAVIRNETDDLASELFLETWFPIVARELERHLGRRLPDDLSVVLSDHLTHERRFPARVAEHVELFDEHEMPTGVALYETYGFGVCTTAKSVHAAPMEVTIGQVAIFIDVDRVARLAAELAVPSEALLGHTVAHEASHAVRGHATDDQITHGWFKEGDAQRDAWHVATELLTDSNAGKHARWVREAQRRLAMRQPPAYRQFATGQIESGLAPADPAEQPQVWQAGTARNLAELVDAGVAEVPVRLVLSHRPRIGDYFYLNDGERTVGPWMLIGSGGAARVGHPSDLEALEEDEIAFRRDYRANVTPPTWLHVRASASLLEGPSQVGRRTIRRLTAWPYDDSVDIAAELRPIIDSDNAIEDAE